MTSTTSDGLAILKGMLDAIYVEAQNNSAFCESLLRTIPKGHVIEIKVAKKAKSQKTFNATDINPVSVLRQEGEITLRKKLSAVSKANLLKLARAHSIALPDGANREKDTKPAIIDGVVAGAQSQVREHAA